MAAMASPPDPSEFAVAVAVGYGHVLDKVLGFLERTSAHTSPAVAVSLALPVLAAYLVVVTLAFALRVAADGFANIVAGNDDEAALGTLSPGVVVGWVSTALQKVAVYSVLFGAVAVALFPLCCKIEIAASMDW